MTRLEELQEDLKGIINGHGGSETPWRKSLSLLQKYAHGYGTGYTAYEKAKFEIEWLIDKEKAKKPTLAKIKDEFDHFGAVNQYTRDYIDALEKCRPWVTRNKETGKIWLSEKPDARFPILFVSSADADWYLKRIGYGDGWEVVQWDGTSE